MCLNMASQMHIQIGEPIVLCINFLWRPSVKTNYFSMLKAIPIGSTSGGWKEAFTTI